MHGADGRGGHWWRPPVHHNMPRPSIPRPNENHPGTGQIRPDPGPRRTGTRCIGAGGKRMPGAGPRRKGPSRPRLPGPGRGTDWPRGEHTVYSYASCMQTRTGTDTPHTDPVSVLIILYSHVRTYSWCLCSYSYVLFLPDPFLGIVSRGGGCTGIGQGKELFKNRPRGTARLGMHQALAAHARRCL